ncbi:MAG: hypothetical protein WCK84_12585 [Bacteroidota bacterium]
MVAIRPYLFNYGTTTNRKPKFVAPFTVAETQCSAMIYSFGGTCKRMSSLRSVHPLGKSHTRN